MSLSRTGAGSMKIILYLLCFLFMLACAAEEPDSSLVEDYLEEDELQNTEESFVDYSGISIEELKNQAVAYTFEDIKAMTPEQIMEIGSYSTQTVIVWFKNFKQWNFAELNEKQIEQLLLLFHYHNNELQRTGHDTQVYIDNDKIIHNIPLEQFKTAIENIYKARLPEIFIIEQLRHDYVSDLCFPSDSDKKIYHYYWETNYYPVEYMKQLSGPQLYLFNSCLRKDQLLALSTEQIIESENFRADDKSVPFSPEKLRAFGEGIAKMTGEDFRKLNQEQISSLTPNQIGLAKVRNSWNGLFEWHWHPEQMPWMSPEQIGGLVIYESKIYEDKKPEYNFVYEEYTMIHRDHIEVLSDEQLRGFSLDQMMNVNIESISAFSPEQLRVLKENGTANEFMEKAIYYQDLGDDIFLDYPEYLNLSRLELLDYFPSLLPIQFLFITLEQARSLPFDTILKLTPEQIQEFPYFVKMLNFSDFQLEHFRSMNYPTEYVPMQTINQEEAIHSYEKKLKHRYGTLNHVKLLTREQVQAIPPEQIPDFPLSAFTTLYRRHFNKEEYTMFREDGISRKQNHEIIPFYKRGRDRYERKENKKFIDYYLKPDGDSGSGEYKAPYEVPLTIEQFANMTLEQFKAIFDEKKWYRELMYLTDEYFNTLSLEKINVLMRYIVPSEYDILPAEERVIARKKELDSIQAEAQ